MKIKIYDAAKDKINAVDIIDKTDDEWRQLLTPEQFNIARKGGTEVAFSKTCPISPNKAGVYQCVCCGTDLFRYEEKFESGTGWPSFAGPVSKLNIKYVTDKSHEMERTEVRCARCDAHLGHVFNDGPKPSGKRYCINTVALKLAD